MQKLYHINIYLQISGVGGRVKIMKLMDEADALGAEAVTRMMAHK